MTNVMQTQDAKGRGILQQRSCSLQCRETYWIETLHTVMLIYVSKRIHFGDDTYNMRVELAVLDWVWKYFS